MMPVLRNQRRARSILRLPLSVVFLAVLTSWIVSYWHRHEWPVVGRRKYAIVGDRGTVQWWRTIKTETVVEDGNLEVREIGFDFATLPNLLGAPRVYLSPVALHQTAEVFVGAEIPLADGTSMSHGERTTIHAVPHWLLAALLGLPLGWRVLSWNRRRAARWLAEGRCAACLDAETGRVR
jgi:hypothetical protein